MKPFGHSIANELISAISALNTEVTYSGPHRTEGDDDLVWLPDAEPLVLHSQEHIASAIDITRSIYKDISALEDVIYALNIDKQTSRSIQSILKTIERKL